jgi:hypothetical protein
MTNLAAGPYTIILTDANLCTSTSNFTITEPTSLNATESHTNVNCTTGFGSATITATGGTLPYTYSWTSGAGNVQTVNNLLAGNYTAIVSDANLCSFSVAVVISQNTDITSGLQKTDNTCNDGCTGTVQITPTGGTGNYTISWSHNSSTQLNQNALCPGNYTVTNNVVYNGQETFEKWEVKYPIH